MEFVLGGFSCKSSVIHLHSSSGRSLISGRRKDFPKAMLGSRASESSENVAVLNVGGQCPALLRPYLLSWSPNMGLEPRPPARPGLA